MFCPQCGAMTFPVDGKVTCRRCKYEGSIGSKGGVQKPDRAVMVSQEEEMMIITEDLETLPKTKQLCEKCGHNEAYFVIRQTRAADEPETRIYQCTKCGYKWREY